MPCIQMESEIVSSVPESILYASIDTYILWLDDRWPSFNGTKLPKLISLIQLSPEALAICFREVNAF